MYDGLELARFEYNEEEDKLKLIKNDKIAWSWLPYIFDYNRDKDMRIVIGAWIKERVFPKNRLDSRKMLKRLGLKKYDALKIAEITRCSLITDPYWLVYDEEDTYYKNSARGKLGENNYPYNSLDIRNEEDYKWRI